MSFVRGIGNLYRTQVELLWRWRSGRRALIKRSLVALVASVIAFHITAWLLPQLDINELGGALIAVLVIAALNLLVRPVILALVASRSVVALVVLTLLFQAAGHPAGGPVGAGGHRRRRPLGRAHHLVRLRRHRRGDRPAVRARRGRVLLRHAGADAREPSARRQPDDRTRPRRHPARRPVPRRAVALAARGPRAGRSRAGSGPALTDWVTGMPCCPRRRRPARRASSMATTTASPTSAGSRRRPGASSWPTIPTTRRSSRAASRTARGC